MEISTGSVLATAFGGAAMGSIITGIISIWLSRKNYKEDYYKKIIDKRIEAYEKLNNYLTSLNIYVLVTSGDKDIKINSIFSSKKNFEENLSLAKSINDKNTWINRKTINEFYSLYNLLSYIYDYLYNDDTSALIWWINENKKEDLLKKVIEEKNKLESIIESNDERIYDILLAERRINAVGIVFFDCIEDKINNLKKMVYNDFQKMYDIEAFLNVQNEAPE